MQKMTTTKKLQPSSDIVRRPLTRSILERMRLPNKFWASEYGRINPGVHLRYVNRYLSKIEEVKRAGYIFILWGENGVGKTAIASILLKEARWKGFPGFFITSQQYMAENFLGSMFDDSLTVSERCRTVDFLVLDDIGKEAVGVNDKKDGRGVVSRYYEELIRDRHSHMRPTIITTNLSPDQIKSRYTKSLVCLFEEDTIAVQVTGPSQRAKSRQSVVHFFE